MAARGRPGGPRGPGSAAAGAVHCRWLPPRAAVRDARPLLRWPGEARLGCLPTLLCCSGDDACTKSRQLCCTSQHYLLPMGGMQTTHIHLHSVGPSFVYAMPSVQTCQVNADFKTLRLPQTVSDYERFMGRLPLEQLDAYECALEIYGSTRMLLATLPTPEDLAQVRRVAEGLALPTLPFDVRCLAALASHAVLTMLPRLF